MVLEKLELLLTANSSQLKREINNTSGTVKKLETSTKKSTSNMLGSFKTLAVGIAALGIGKMISASVRSGMEAIESDNLFEVAMGNQADSVRAWSEELQDKLGLGAYEIRKTTGTIYNMINSMGIAGTSATNMSKGITLLAQDMASFYNMSSDEAMTKLQAGLTGETEPLKRIGILVNENTIKEVAYRNGIAQTGAQLTEQEKVMARYVAIMEQTSNAQGDLARTINSPANMMRILKQQVANLGIAFGNLLMPAIGAIIPYVTAFVRVITMAINALSKFLGIAGASGGSSMADNFAGASSGAGALADNAGNASKNLGKASGNAKDLKKALAGFDEMNVIKEDGSTSSGGAGASGAGGGVGGVGTDFEIGEYDTSWLDNIDSKVDTIVEGMKEKWNQLKNVMALVWNSEPVQAFVGAVTTYATFVYDYWKALGIAFYENLLITWEEIKGSVLGGIENLSLFWTTFWTDITIGIEEWGPIIIEKMTTLFNSIWETAIGPALALISMLWEDFTSMLATKWDKYGAPLIDKVGKFVGTIIDLFQQIWDDIIDPIITPFLEQLTWLWETYIKDLVDQFSEFVLKLVGFALDLWNNVFYPIISYLIDRLAPAWSFLSSFVIGVLGSMIGFIAGIASSIFQILGGIIDFVVGVFTGDWKRAWEGVKNIFSGIVKGLGTIFKFPINVIIDGINAFIAGVNKIKIPDWVPGVGGKSLNISKIPKLAKGGIVDGATLAVVGEAGKEAVMPLENNTGWITELAGKINERSGNGQPIQLIVQIGEDTLVEKLINGLNDNAFLNNGSKVVI